MNKKAFVLLLILFAALLAACAPAAGANSTPVATTATGADPQGTPGPGGFEMEPLARLAYGTFALEDTAEAVTAEQAATLLPLWQAVQALGQSDTTAEAEMTALEGQLQASYTPGQVAAIEALPLGADNLQALMEDLGLDLGGFQGGNGGPPPDFTPPADFGGGGGGFPPDGGPGGGGFPPDGGGFGGGPGGGGFNPQDLDADQLATLQAQRGAGGAFGRGAQVPQPVLAALIELLETRSTGE